MIDLDSYEAQAEEGELHVRQIIDVIRELRECRAERDAAIARAEAAEALAASRPEITPEDARDGAVITGLVRAMRESRGGLLGPNENFGGIGAAKDCLRVGALGSAAWHIAHAISQMASGDEDASRVLGERGW